MKAWRERSNSLEKAFAALCKVVLIPISPRIPVFLMLPRSSSKFMQGIAMDLVVGDIESRICLRFSPPIIMVIELRVMVVA